MEGLNTALRNRRESLEKASTRRAAAALGALMLVIAPVAAAETTMTIAHLYPDSLTDNDVAPSLAHFKQLVERNPVGCPCASR